jgi:hypothetical protein
MLIQSMEGSELASLQSPTLPEPISVERSYCTWRRSHVRLVRSRWSQTNLVRHRRLKHQLPARSRRTRSRRTRSAWTNANLPTTTTDQTNDLACTASLPLRPRGDTMRTADIPRYMSSARSTSDGRDPVTHKGSG